MLLFVGSLDCGAHAGEWEIARGYRCVQEKDPGLGGFPFEQGSIQEAAVLRWLVIVCYVSFSLVELLVGENMAEGGCEGQVAIVEYRDEADGEAPYLMLIAQAIEQEKA